MLVPFEFSIISWKKHENSNGTNTDDSLKSNLNLAGEGCY